MTDQRPAPRFNVARHLPRAREIEKRCEGIARPRIAEIGVEIGLFTEALLYLMPHAHVLMVDNWAVAEDQPAEYRATRDPSALRDGGDQAIRRARAKAVAKAHATRCDLIDAPSIEAATRIRRESLDLVFIDADHSEAGVRADIGAWTGKVKPGGWIGGHDYDNPSPDYDFSGVARAVHAVFGDDGPVENGGGFTWWVQL